MRLYASNVLFMEYGINMYTYILRFFASQELARFWLRNEVEVIGWVFSRFVPNDV